MRRTPSKYLLHELGVHCDLLVHSLQPLIQLYALQHLWDGHGQGVSMQVQVSVNLDINVGATVHNSLTWNHWS